MRGGHVVMSKKDPGKAGRAVDSLFSKTKPTPKVEPGDAFRSGTKPKVNVDPKSVQWDDLVERSGTSAPKPKR
jgi:hypothetical protein